MEISKINIYPHYSTLTDILLLIIIGIFIINILAVLFHYIDLIRIKIKFNKFPNINDNTNLITSIFIGHIKKSIFIRNNKSLLISKKLNNKKLIYGEIKGILRLYFQKRKNILFYLNMLSAIISLFVVLIVFREIYMEIDTIEKMHTTGFVVHYIIPLFYPLFFAALNCLAYLTTTFSINNAIIKYGNKIANVGGR